MKNIIITASLTALLASAALNALFMTGKMEWHKADYVEDLTQPVRLAHK